MIDWGWILLVWFCASKRKTPVLKPSRREQKYSNFGEYDIFFLLILNNILFLKIII